MRHVGLTLHKAEPPRADVMQITASFSITTASRSIIDAAATTDLDHLARLIDEARNAGLITLRTHRSRSERVDARAALSIERALRQVEPR